MADAREFKINGLDEVLRKMRALPIELRKKPTQTALGRAAKVIREQAKQNALQVDDPQTGRRIADNIIQRVRSGRYRRTGDVMVSIGVGTEKGPIPKGNPDTGKDGNTPHWHLREFGTQDAAAHPFMRPAADQKAEAAAEKFSVELNKLLDKLVASMK